MNNPFVNHFPGAQGDQFFLFQENCPLAVHQTGKGSEKGRFPGPVAADDRKEIPSLGPHLHPVENLDPVIKGFQVVDFKPGQCPDSSPPSKLE